MNPNVFISQSESELEKHFATDFIAHIDGQQVVTLRKFYEELADLLEIPDFGFNLDALNDALNDLQWLEDKRIVIYFTNTADLIRQERDPDKVATVLSLMDAAAEDWKWVDDEDDLMDQKEVVLVFEDSPRILQLLEKGGIAYKMLAEMPLN